MAQSYTASHTLQGILSTPGKLHAWKRRWCIIEDGMLTIWQIKKGQPSRIHLCYLLEDITDINNEPHVDADTRAFTFTITITTNNEHTIPTRQQIQFIADNEDDKEMWCQTITSMCGLTKIDKKYAISQLVANQHKAFAMVEIFPKHGVRFSHSTGDYLPARLLGSLLKTDEKYSSEKSMRIEDMRGLYLDASIDSYQVISHYLRYGYQLLHNGRSLSLAQSGTKLVNLEKSSSRES